MRGAAWIVSLFVAIFIAVCNAQTFYVAAPNALRLGVDETIAIAADGVNVAAVHVYIQDHPGKIKNITKKVFEVQGGTPKISEIQLNPKDFPPTFLLNSEEKNSVILNVDSVNFHKEIVIPLSVEAGYVFIQTDKPIYTPKQIVGIRVISLNEDRLPSAEQFQLQIKNPDGIVVEETTFNKPPRVSRKAFVSHVYKFPTYPVLGEWSVNVLYGYKFAQSTSVRFELQEYVLPTFSLELNTQEVILPESNAIKSTLKAKYVYGKPVEGSVTFRLAVQAADSTHGTFFVTIGPKQLKDGTYILHANTSLLKSHKDIGWFDGIEGSRLVVEATVRDVASGNKEVVTDATAVFAKSPFRISFRRCLADFKPGLVSVFEADVNYVDGRPAKNIRTRISAKADGQDLHIKEPTATSNEEGKVSFSIHPEVKHSTVDITIETVDPRFAGNQAKGHFTQRKFEGSGYIAIERSSEVALKTNDMFDRSVHIKPAEAMTDVYYTVVSKGKIVLINKLPRGQFEVQRVTFRVTHEMVPSFRIVVFAHHGNVLIADSLKINVQNACNSKAEVQIDPQFGSKEPGSDGKVVIHGTGSTLVGLLGVDEAVYALSKNDLLTKSKMFSKFGQHDLGCGPGGGLKTDDVLRNAGLAITTSRYTPSNDIFHSACEVAFKRKKRAIGDKLTEYEGLDQECCGLGLSKDDLNRDCETRTNILVQHFAGQYENCTQAFLECCIYGRENGVTDMKIIRNGPFQSGRSKNKVDEGAFITDEEESFLEAQTMVRKDFRETWIFDDIIIGPDEQEEVALSLPHSITTWVIQAVSVSSVHGMCVAEPQKIISFKNVFLQLNLPYSVVRNEQIEIQATVFNYGPNQLAAITYMYGAKDLCTGYQVNEKSTRKRLVIPSQSAKSVVFPVIPLKEGVFDIKVTVLSNGGSDIIWKKLNVVPEGFTVEKDISVVLDPSNQQKRKKRHLTTDTLTDSIDDTEKKQVTAVKLNIPEGFVPGTESCVITAIGDQFGPTVETALTDPDKLLLKPRGCGEQNMMYLAPTMYTMRYLKVSGKMTPENEEKGYEFIRHGYGSQLSFRKEDGSYAAYQNTPVSTWLTAFVTKIFCQANELVHIDEEVMCSAVRWLKNAQQPDGSIIENHPVYHKDMMGGVDGAAPMTAFALIALEECKCDIPNLHIAKARAMAFLEGHLGDVNKPLPVAIVAYALALSGSDLKQGAYDKLLSKGTYNNDNNMLHWQTENSARDVETTSYALLTQLLFNDMDRANAIVNWLNTKRLAAGAFHSTQDTVMALQALSEYAIRAQMPGINLVSNITSSNDRNFQATMKFNEENALVLQGAKVRKVGGMLFINTAGHGVGQLSVKLRYNLPYADKPCKFDASVNLTEVKEARPLAGGKDIADGNLNLLPRDVIRSAEGALNGVVTEAPKLDVDPRNRAGPRRERRSTYLNETYGHPRRFKREKNVENSNPNFNVEICVRYLGNQDAGMSIVDAGIFSGYDPDLKDLDRLQKDPTSLIQRYEISTRGVILYLEKVPIAEKHCFSFRIIQDYIVGNTQTSIIKIYDYYNPDESCTLFYSPKGNSPILRKICDNGICQCAEGGCPLKEPFEQHISTDVRKMRDDILKAACDDFDYVWKGRLNGEIKTLGGFMNIPFQIDEVVKEGIEKREFIEGENRLLMSRDNCGTAMLNPDFEYLIMGKDGQKYANENGEVWHRYMLDKTTAIHLWTAPKLSANKKLQKALDWVTANLKEKGCGQ